MSSQPFSCPRVSAAKVQRPTIAIISPSILTVSLLVNLWRFPIDHAAHRRGGDADVAAAPDPGAIAHFDAISARRQREASQRRGLSAAPLAACDDPRAVECTGFVAHLHQTSDHP